MIAPAVKVTPGTIAAQWIVAQIEKISGRQFRPYQSDWAETVIRSVLVNDGRRLTLLWARQIGKTETGQLVLLGLLIFLPHLAKQAAYAKEFPILAAYADGFLVGFVAPKMETARIPFKRLRRMVHSPRVEGHLQTLGLRVLVSSTQELTFSNGSSAIALSGAPTAFQEGHTLHFLWIEEAQRVAQYQLRKVFEPMLAATNGTMVEVGTAGSHRCAFLEDIESNKRLVPEDHSEITWLDALAIMFADAPDDPWAERYDTYIRKQISRMPAGEQSEAFRQNYKLEWILSSYQLVSSETWGRMRGDGLSGRPLLPRGQFTPGHARVFGLDFAKVNDSTVVTAGEVWDDHVRAIDWLELRGSDWEDQVDIIVPWCTERGGQDPQLDPTYVCDSTGVGDPVTDMLKRRLRARVIGLTYTPQAKDTLYKHFTGRLPGVNKGTRLVYPDGQPGDAEFARFELQVLNCEVETRGNLVSYHHPDKQDEDLGSEVCHDDYPDSLFNMLHAAEQPRASFTTLSFRGAAVDPLHPAAETDADRDRRHLGNALRGSLIGGPAR
jgi:hypothetical protein